MSTFQQNSHAYNTRAKERYEKLSLDEQDKLLQRISAKKYVDTVEDGYIYNTLMFALGMTCMPFIVCDLYYAASDEEACLLQTFDTMKLSLYEYLVISAFYTTVAITIYVLNQQVNEWPEKEWKKLEKFASFVNRTFLVTWTVAGGILFWSFNREQCSSKLNMYMNVSLICKFIIYGVYFAYSYYQEQTCL